MKTQIENTSGAGRFFGYLPPHGLYLDASETVEVDGDLRSALAAGRNRYGRKTEIAALDADCADGSICLTEVVEDCCSSSSSSSS
jgi:hypothetical protein